MADNNAALHSISSKCRSVVPKHSKLMDQQQVQ